MHRTESISLDQLPSPPGVDDPCKPIAYRARSSVQGLLCAILCSMACGCGGGGGSSSSGSNPLPPPTSASLLAVTNATTGTIDILTIATQTGTRTAIARNTFTA